MNDSEKKIEELFRQLADLKTRQVQMRFDIVQLEKHIDAVKQSTVTESENSIVENIRPVSIPVEEVKQSFQQTIHTSIETEQQKEIKPTIKQSNNTRGLEDFIGTNIISKVGILITIIGVFIGAKYAIDKELISPAMRIVLGYVVGSVLMGLAFRLKQKYLYFSSILMGGGLAIMYFITYIGFSFYQLFPQMVAFAFMFVTTVGAVAIALWYNQKVIALLGQVAAYGIPFLLSNNSGNVLALFTYISIINVGLVYLSFKKEWKLLYRIAFFLTWLIYFAWLTEGQDVKAKFVTGLVFITINFFTFYTTFLSFKTIKKELFDFGEIAVLLVNALLFFSIGYHLISDCFSNTYYLTYFTIGNAIIHFAVGYGMYKKQLADTTVSQFILSLGLLFFTLTIPMELDGSWVTLLWAFEATGLVLIGLRNQRSIYLQLAISLFITSFISLIDDWGHLYPTFKYGFINTASTFQPFLNIHFSLSLFVCFCFGIIAYKVTNQTLLQKAYVAQFFYHVVLPVAFLLFLYFTFFLEIQYVYDLLISHVNRVVNERLWKTETLFIYSIVYLSIWLVVNNKWLQIKALQTSLLVASAFVNVLFLTTGLYILGELRQHFLQVHTSLFDLLLNRYLFLASLALLWSCCYTSFSLFSTENNIRRMVSVLFNLSLLTIISNECIHWMDIAGYANQYKLGLSIIWGAYALGLIFIGIIQKKKHLRISAIVLFVVTLIKLFFYDLSSLSTISKTIVLVLLGVLLLIASFLYNKYKDKLFEKEENNLDA